MPVSMYVNKNFKPIIALVYNFEEKHLYKAKKYWERKMAQCPVDIDLRFYNYNKLKENDA